MNGINLIPAARREARARGRQLRIWCFGAAFCSLGLLGVHVTLWSAWRPTDVDPVAELGRLTKEVTRGEQLDRASRARLAEAKGAAQAAREVSDQPDWGVLLTYIAGRLGSQAVLDSLRLEPAAPPAAGAPKAPAGKGASAAAERGRCSLVLTGVAKTQDAASDVAIELKRSELFQSVTLVETRRTVFMGAGAVAFRIECAIAGAGGGD